MKLIVGLGNPGAEYANTRHNAGFMAIDAMERRHAPGAIWRSRFHGLALEVLLPDRAAADYDPAEGRWHKRAPAITKALLLKPTTYMNRSGQGVGEAIRFYKLDPSEDLLVLVDDVALPVGSIRVRAGGSAGGHNGLSDIERALGTSAYPRCRIGIDAPGRIPQKDYVLGRFAPDQKDAIASACERAADAAELWASTDTASTMNVFNVKEKKNRERDQAPEQADTNGTPAEDAA